MAAKPVAELGMPQHVRPELEEDRQPAVVTVAPLDRAPWPTMSNARSGPAWRRPGTTSVST